VTSKKANEKQEWQTGRIGPCQKKKTLVRGEKDWKGMRSMDGRKGWFVNL